MRTQLLVGVMVVGIAACGRSSTTPPGGLQAAAAKKQQEEQAAAAKVADEQDALANQAEKEDAARKEQASELPSEFRASSTLPPAGSKTGGGQASGGGTPVLVPHPMPPIQVQGAVPYDQAFPPQKDHLVRVGIMSGSSEEGAGNILARMFSAEDRKYLEDTLGLGIQIAYVSETDRPRTTRSRVFYRPQFMKAAVEIAALIPQPQSIEVMTEEEAAKRQVDILVQIGTDLK